VTRRLLLATLVRAGAAGFVAVACQSAPVATATQAPATAAPTLAPTLAPTPVPTAAPTAAAPASAPSWTVGNQSKATVRVREQLVGRDLPNDAVLVTTGAEGSFVLQAGGTFAATSKIAFDLTTLTSDSRDRDNFVKRDTLGTQQFPKAELVPLRATGLPASLPATGDLAFKLTANMTVRGRSKEVTFDVVAKRERGTITATATANPSFKFGDFGLTVPSVPFRVVSVTDEIRLAVDLVATGPSA